MKNLITVGLFFVGFFVGNITTSVKSAPTDRIQPKAVVINITTVGPIGVPFEWWGDKQGGVVHLGTGPDFHVYLNGEEKFPLPCPVVGGC